MLRSLRKRKTAKKIWIVLAIIIVPAFMLWGLGGALRSQRETAYVGKIFGKNISSLDYKDALDAVKNLAIIQYGDDLSEIQKYLNLESQAWERLILLSEAKKRKINVSDKEVIEAIQKYAFFERNGKFDNRMYPELLQYVFHTQARIFEEQTRQNLMLSKLYNQVTQNLKVNEEEIKEGYKKLNEEISIYYIAAIPSDFAKDIAAPSEQEIKDYFNRNSLEFKEPPSFNIEYVSLDSEDKIKNITSRLNKREDFIKAASELGAEVKVTGFFSQTDPIPGIGWSPEILNLILKLKIGQFATPIRLDKNYYILRLKEKKEAAIADFEKIKDKASQMLIKDISIKMAKEKIEECLKKLQELYRINPKQINFAEVAKIYGLKSDVTGLFKYGSYIEAIGASDNLWMAAQRLKEDEISSVADMGLAGFYIIKLKNKTSIDEKKFDSEKNEFSLRLLEQKKQEYFTKFIEELSRKSGIPQ